MNPLTYIYDESMRQSATVAEMGGMCLAYQDLLKFISPGHVVLNEDDIKKISATITGNSDYRRVPAVFNQGMPAINSENVPNAMSRFVEGVNNEIELGNIKSEIDLYVVEFLLIHPFADGNGRVASLLRNYLLGTLDDPSPLPYYFGDN